MLDQIVILKPDALPILRIDHPTVAGSLKARPLQIVWCGAKCPLFKLSRSRPAQEGAVDIGADDTHIPTRKAPEKFTLQQNGNGIGFGTCCAPGTPDAEAPIGSVPGDEVGQNCVFESFELLAVAEKVGLADS